MIYVTGDTHGDSDIHKLGAHKLLHLQKSDYVIILGDFGLIFDCDKNSPRERYWLDWLDQKPFTTLFIDGNHENFDRLLQYPIEDFLGGKASQISETVWYLRRGEIYQMNSCKVFCFGGASSVDKQWRTPGISWWPQEIPSESEYQYALRNLEKHDWEVDYVLSHTCPESVRRMIPQLPPNDFISAMMPYKRTDTVNEMLETIRGKLRFKHWYFGHFHNDLDIDVDDKVFGTQKFTVLWNEMRELDLFTCSNNSSTYPLQ